MELIYNFDVDVIVFVLRDVDFFLIIIEVKRCGKEIVVIGVDLGFFVVF